MKDLQGVIAAGFGVKVPPAVVLDHGDLVRDRCKQWVEAGAQVLLAPTLQATPAGLKPFGLAHKTSEINQLAMELLQEAAVAMSSPPFLAAQMGPLPGLLSGAGFDQAYIHYHEQAKPLVVAGPHLVVLRGIGGVGALKAALVALREFWSGPVLALFPAHCPCSWTWDLQSLLEAFQVEGAGLQIPCGGGRPVDWLKGLRAWSRWAGRLTAVDLGDVFEEPEAAARFLPWIREAFDGGVDLAVFDGMPPRPWIEALRPPRRREASLPAARFEEEAAETAPPNKRPPLTLFAVPIASPEDLELALDRATPPSLAELKENSYRGFQFLESEHLDFDRLPSILRGLEERTGRPLGVIAASPFILEIAAKASSTSALLVVEGSQPADLECVLEIAKRYGARLVLPLRGMEAAESNEWVASLVDEVEALRYLAQTAGFPWERIHLEGTVLLHQAGLHQAGLHQTGLGTALERLRVQKKVQWAVTLPYGSGETENRPSLAPWADLVIGIMTTHG
ncbi:MAG: homocysteine S-methyltransferase family protein [Planctomycetes bacterium]|nr:homocysteine S-methyltransferase family protein [Planctomycetota bacterium]